MLASALAIPESLSIPRHRCQYETGSHTASRRERQTIAFKAFRVAGVTLTAPLRDAIISSFTEVSCTGEVNPLNRVRRALDVPAALIWWVVGKHFEASEAARRAAIAAYDEVWADASLEARNAA